MPLFIGDAPVTKWSSMEFDFSLTYVIMFWYMCVGQSALSTIDRLLSRKFHRCSLYVIQYSHSFPGPVDRTSASAGYTDTPTDTHG